MAWSRACDGAWPSRRRDEYVLIVVATLVLTAITWPVRAYLPAAGLDSSWASGLHMAAGNSDLGFGTDLIFTHGPLGFLMVPQLWGGTYPLALAASAVTQMLLVALVVVGLRRSVPWIPTVLIALILLLPLTAAAESSPNRLAVLVALVAVNVALVRFGDRSRTAGPAALGAAAGPLLLTTFGVGVMALVGFALAWLAATDRERGRGLVIYTVAAVASFLIVWLALARTVSGLFTWLRLSAQETTGFPWAMGTGPVDWTYLAALPLALALVAAAVVTSRSWSVSRRVYLGLLILVLLILFLRKGLGRNDADHFLYLAFTLTVLALAFPMRARWRYLFASVAAYGLLAMWVVLPGGFSNPPALFTTDRVRALADQAATAVSPSRRERLLAESRAALVAQYVIPDSVRKAVGSNTVAVEPFEIAAAWALGARWRPAPVMQPYAAYTEDLDALNAEAFSGEAAPQRILVQNGAKGIDGRFVDADSPAYNVALVCNYRMVVNEGYWRVYARARPRCGELRPLRPWQAAEPGAEVRVPPLPGRAAVLVARIQARPTLRQRLIAAALVPRTFPTITLNKTDTHRFVYATGIAGWPMRMNPELRVLAKDPPKMDINTFRLDGVASPYEVRFEWRPLLPKAAPSRSPARG